MKLIRSKIASELRERKDSRVLALAGDKKINKALSDKLLEECIEVIQELGSKEMSDNLIEEIADVREVLEAVMHFHKISEKTVEKVKERKRHKKGDFKNFDFLIDRGTK